MMMLYILKTILISGALWGFYKLALEKEGCLQFNRAFLLGATLLPFLLPLFTIEMKSPAIPPPAAPEIAEVASIPLLQLEEPLPAVQPATTNPIDPAGIALGILLIGSCYLLIRFLRNIGVLTAKMANRPNARYREAPIILIDQKIPPQSFLGFIFLEKEAYEAGSIPEEVLIHELVHLRQHHSLDILWIELLIVLSWFNPFWWLIRRSIRLNHEFLADRGVVEQTMAPHQYQYMLIDAASAAAGLQLTNTFQFSFIKKRILMITRPKTTNRTWLKMAAVLPLLALLTFSTATRVEAQTPVPELKEVPPPPPPPPAPPAPLAPEAKAAPMPAKPPKPAAAPLPPPPPIPQIRQASAAPDVGISRMPSIVPVGTTYPEPGPGVTDAQLEAYLERLESLGFSPDGSTDTNWELEEDDILYIQKMYLQMDARQREMQPFIMFKLPAYYMSTPSGEQLEEWAAHTYFHVYIDGQRVENDVLEDYRNTDFTSHRVKLKTRYTDDGKSKKYYQVDLWKPKYYKEQLIKAEKEGKANKWKLVLRQQ